MFLKTSYYIHILNKCWGMLQCFTGFRMPLRETTTSRTAAGKGQSSNGLGE